MLQRANSALPTLWGHFDSRLHLHYPSKNFTFTRVLQSLITLLTFSPLAQIVMGWRKYLQISLHCKIFVLEARNVTDIQNRKPTWLKPYWKTGTSKIYTEQSGCTSHYFATLCQCKVKLVFANTAIIFYFVVAVVHLRFTPLSYFFHYLYIQPLKLKWSKTSLLNLKRCAFIQMLFTY